MKKRFIPAKLPREITRPIRLKRPSFGDAFLNSSNTEELLSIYAASNDKYWREVSALRFEKFAKLINHYRLANENEHMDHILIVLLMKILEDFVEGFQVEDIQPRGRKKKWNNETWALIWYDVEQYKLRHPKASSSTACSNLAKLDYWRNWLGQGTASHKAKTLLNQYLQSKKSIYCRKWTEMSNGESGPIDWEAFKECVLTWRQYSAILNNLEHPLIK